MTTRPRGGSTPIYLELGQKRVFACSFDWPGWGRSGRTEELAIEALASYAPRYAVVAEQAGIRWPATVADAFDVVERLPGNMTTDFGAPGQVPEADSQRLAAAETKRLTALVEASWAVFDQVVAKSPAQLRKGPRGGGRDRDKMVAHVLAAEAAYARKVGVRHPEPDITDADAIAALRADLLGALRAPSDGTPPEAKGWPVRYAARRVAWHVLDHAWEMQDRSPGRTA